MGHPDSLVRSNRSATPLVAGALEALAIAGGFVVLGLGWAAQRSVHASGPVGADPGASTYVCEAMSTPEPRVWLVDGYNVLHAGVLRGRDRAQWWSADRRRQLLERVERFDCRDAEVWVVFDGSDDPAERDAESGSSRCVFAPCADDWLVDRVRRDPDPSRIAVVTADRQVAGRAHHGGARVVAPRAFLARCEA